VTAAPSAPLQPSRQPASELCVVLGCHHLACALPIRAVDRLALPDAAQPEPARRRASAGSGGVPPPPLVRVGEQRWAAWDLGVLLGLAPAQGAWVLLRVPFDGAELSLALRTGPCFAVQAVRRLAALPPGIFQSRRAALAGTFANAAVKGARLPAPVGLWIEPFRLWEPLELAASAAALREER
jgi:hypothetical protein